jgi:quercetin dioxygenase-like cupin family protein
VLEIKHPRNEPWQRAMPQLQGGKELAIHLKTLFSGADLMVTYTRYDPALVVAPHRHEGVEVIYVIEGSMRVGEVDCSTGSVIVLDGNSVVGPIVAGDAGAILLEVFHGAGSWWPQPEPPNEQYERLVRERRIVELPGAGRSPSS